MEIIAESKCFGGRQLRIKHDSSACQCEMNFSLFLPPQETETKVPLLTWLSGLTCSDENFVQKAGAQRIAAELGVALLVPDTSPRGPDVADSEVDAWSLGQGAGFYVNATESPWASHYQMETYITQELQHLLAESDFNLNFAQQGIFGHSMGGHGALILGLKHQHIYQSISAFAPICSPCTTPWGQAALSHYLGVDKQAWMHHDASQLLEIHGYDKALLIDQGEDDPFVEDELKPHILDDVCKSQNIDLTLRIQEGYDHSYFFIASFIDDHIRFHLGLL